MKEQLNIADLMKGVKFEGFLLVKNAAQKTSGKTGGKFVDMNLIDRTGEINAKVWDPTAAAPEAGNVIKVRGSVEEFNNRLQMRIDKMRDCEPEDEIEMDRLVPCAPMPSDAMLDEILNRADAIKNKQLKDLVLKCLDEAGEDKLMIYPAAKSLHHAERGGLLHHTLSILRTAELICGIYTMLDSDLLAAGIILHDLCKIEELVCDGTGIATEYSMKGNLVGHLSMGINMIDRCGRELGTDTELMMLLEHMMLSHHGVPEYGSPRRPMFPEAEVLHALDDLDTKLNIMDEACRKINPGSFTECIRSLDDRRLYRRKGYAEGNE